MVTGASRPSILSEASFASLVSDGFISSKSFVWKSCEGRGLPTPDGSLCASYFLAVAFFPHVPIFAVCATTLPGELIHLNPNFILVLAMFVHIC